MKLSPNEQLAIAIILRDGKTDLLPQEYVAFINERVPKRLKFINEFIVKIHSLGFGKMYVGRIGTLAGYGNVKVKHIAKPDKFSKNFYFLFEDCLTGSRTSLSEISLKTENFRFTPSC